jgi:fumarylacetoacetase
MESSLQSKSIIKYAEDNHFPLENIPFGCYEASPGTLHACTRIGDKFVCLADLFEKLKGGPLFSKLSENIFKGPLNTFMGLGNEYRKEARQSIQNFFMDPANAGYADGLKDAAACEGQMVLPCQIGDYTDFYSSKNHAYNIGCLFRGADNAY